MDAIPVVSQFKSLWQAMTGDLQGASRTQELFSRKCVGVSQLRSLVEVMCNQEDEALKTQLIFSSPGNLAGQGVMVVSAIAAPYAVGAAISGMGFGQGGIVAGTAAAEFMASYGGAVSANSLCAFLQSAGAVGLQAGTTAVVSTATGTAAGAAAGMLSDAVTIEKNVNSDKFGIQTCHEYFVTAEPYHIECKVETLGNRQEFQFFHISENIFVIQCWHEGYLYAKDGQVSLSRSISNENMFEFTLLSKDGQVSFKSMSNNKYLGAEKDGTLTCEEEKVGEKSSFKLVMCGGTVQPDA